MRSTFVAFPSSAALTSASEFRASSFLPSSASSAWRGDWGSEMQAQDVQGALWFLGQILTLFCIPGLAGGFGLKDAAFGESSGHLTQNIRWLFDARAPCIKGSRHSRFLLQRARASCLEAVLLALSLDHFKSMSGSGKLVASRHDCLEQPGSNLSSVTDRNTHTAP